ncbi:hypothetical protein T4D_16184 [Trichinella pseudospiralis]|uniref:Uncharacterized protein n=1 Tax=Trichinella pseudospiralis TaxID=6337 RepID=A0A0V1G429_TRIPS|nr:hypothetical protein T4D_16184 [Trichinella pseudospiralis]
MSESALNLVDTGTPMQTIITKQQCVTTNIFFLATRKFFGILSTLDIITLQMMLFAVDMSQINKSQLINSSRD